MRCLLPAINYLLYSLPLSLSQQLEKQSVTMVNIDMAVVAMGGDRCLFFPWRMLYFTEMR